MMMVAYKFFLVSNPFSAWCKHKIWCINLCIYWYYILYTIFWAHHRLDAYIHTKNQCTSYERNLYHNYNLIFLVRFLSLSVYASTCRPFILSTELFCRKKMDRCYFPELLLLLILWWWRWDERVWVTGD